MEKSELQTRLKEETMNLHMEAENHPLMKAMYNKTIKKEHLIMLLVNLRCVYDVVQRRLLQPYIMQNSDLDRLPLIDKDIALLSVEMETETLGRLLTPLECTDLWVAWCWAKPTEMLKAELYTRWLADLYGGRMLTKTVTPHAMYTCRDYQSTITAIRNKLDQPLTNSDITEEDIVQETLSFFEFHLELFNEIYNGNSSDN